MAMMINVNGDLVSIGHFYAAMYWGESAIDCSKFWLNIPAQASLCRHRGYNHPSNGVNVLNISPASSASRSSKATSTLLDITTIDVQ